MPARPARLHLVRQKRERHRRVARSLSHTRGFVERFERSARLTAEFNLLANFVKARKARRLWNRQMHRANNSAPRHRRLPQKLERELRLATAKLLSVSRSERARVWIANTLSVNGGWPGETIGDAPATASAQAMRVGQSSQEYLDGCKQPLATIADAKRRHSACAATIVAKASSINCDCSMNSAASSRA